MPHFATRSEYVNHVTAWARLGFFRPRRFRVPQEWAKWGGSDFRSTPLRGLDASLSDVVEHPHVVVLGDPGSGKSTIGRAAVFDALRRGWIPVTGRLRSFAGSLEESFDASISADVLRGETVLYILDGLDEVAASSIAAAREAIAELAHAPSARVLITCRQAFFAAEGDALKAWPAFHLLDLTDRDVDAFLEDAGVDRTAFRAEASSKHIFRELSNPFALETFAGLFRDTGALAARRSEAVRHVVDSLLASRPTALPTQERRGLRMLAVAMEALATNELSDATARGVLTAAMRITAEDADRLLAGLANSMLAKTRTGVAFLLASYGEYLAAEELSDVQDLTLIMGLIRLDGGELSDSWRNSICYLIELHPGVRSWFARKHADWTLGASPNCFSPDERDDIVRAVTSTLAARGQLLLYHPTLGAPDLAGFVGAKTAAELRQAVGGADPVAAANAVLILGLRGDRSLAPEALRIGLDQSLDVHLRHSALTALQSVGEPGMIPPLLEIADWNEATVSSRLDAAGALADEAHLAPVLGALVETDTLISGAFLRFSTFTSPAAVEATLGALRSMDPAKMRLRAGRYTDAIWAAMATQWRADWADPVAEILLNSEAERGTDSFDSDLIEALLKSPAASTAVGRAVVDRLLAEPRRSRGINTDVMQLVGLEDAERVARLGDPEMTGYLRAFGDVVVRRALTPPAEAIAQADDADESGWARRAREHERQLEVLRAKVVSDAPAAERLKALAQLSPARWPDLDRNAADALTPEVERWLTAVDLQNTITWATDTSWSMPRDLPVVLAVINRYELRLVDSKPLALALNAGQQEHVLAYHRRFGLDDGGLELVDRGLRDARTPNGAVDGLLRFAAAASGQDGIADAVSLVATSARPPSIRSAAVRALGAIDGHQGQRLVRVRSALTADDQRTLDNALVDRGHRATIERLLQQLIDDPAQLAAADRSEPFDSPIGWLAKVNDPQYWPKLVTLRERALQASLPYSAGHITQVMSKIDGLRLAALIESQLPLAPAEWRAAERIHAARVRHGATIAAAARTPFETVIARLRQATTMKVFKIWAEGPKDIPAFAELVKLLPDGAGHNVNVASIGGWGHIKAPEWRPTYLADGSHDQIVILDSDDARRPGQTGVSFSVAAQAALDKMRAHDIDCRVLNRYALENYFPQSAYEAVMGAHVAKHFPLNPDAAVSSQIGGYKKDMNGRLAQHTTLLDLASTDLEAILLEIDRRAG